MIVGDPRTFAIESGITLAYAQQSQMALGFFVFYLMGRSYGVRKADATMLADPFNEVGRRIAKRGSHNLWFAMNSSATDIADSFRRAIYGTCEDGDLIFGATAHEFTNSISSKRIAWSAYCDEAFDDGSYILHVEDDRQVRLIAFRGTADFLYDPASLRELCLPQEEFYKILQEWHDRFLKEWKSLPKVSNSAS